MFSEIDPELYEKLKKNSGNWQKMLDTLTEAGIEEEDAKKMLRVLLMDEGEEDESE